MMRSILEADHVIDMGPGAGVHGGLVVLKASLIRSASTASLTGKYLSGIEEMLFPQTPQPKKDRQIKLIKASGNNLHDVTVEFPLGVMTCVTGVSGSGKSTLVLETLWKTMARRLIMREVPAPLEKIEGLHLVDKVVDIDQSPMAGRLFNPATYTGAFTPIREWLRSARSQGARLCSGAVQLQCQATARSSSG